MNISKSELREKYYSMRTEDLAKELGVSPPTLIKILKNNGIEQKGKGNYKRHNIVVVR